MNGHARLPCSWQHLYCEKNPLPTSMDQARPVEMNVRAIGRLSVKRVVSAG